MSNYAGIFLIVAAIIVGYFLALPQWNTVMQLRDEGEYLDTVSLELDSLMQASLALDTIFDRISQEDRDRIEEAIPQGAQQKKFMVHIEHFASVTDVNLTDIGFTELTKAAAAATRVPTPAIQPLLPQNIGIIKELNIQVTVKGTYENFKTFLTIIERNLPIVDVEEIKFSSPEGNAFTFNLGLKSYYQ